MLPTPNEEWVTELLGLEQHKASCRSGHLAEDRTDGGPSLRLWASRRDGAFTSSVNDYDSPT